MPATKLLVLDGHDFGRFQHDFDNLPYGVDRLTSRGYAIVHSDWAWRDTPFPRLFRRIAGRVDNVLELPMTSVASQVRQAQDVALCLGVFEYQALAYERLRRLARHHLPEQVVMTCWMAAWSTTFTGRRLRVLCDLVSRAAALTVFSTNQVDQLAQVMDAPREKFHVVPYGVDTSYYTPREGHDDYVAAAGNDIGRDWPTFLHACAALPTVTFRVASRHSFDRLTVPSNVQMLGAVDHSSYRRLVQGARCVVIPTYPLAYPSGQSVALEAYAMGKPIVAVGSAAMRDYLVSGAAWSYRPGDAGDLARTIKRVIGAPENELADIGRLARRTAVARFSNEAMWRAIADVLDSVNHRVA